MKIKLLSQDAKIPTRGSADAAGYDLYASEDFVIQPYSTEKITTGIAMEIPKGYWGGVFARSGLAIKQGLRPANCVGVIDSDYRGEILVALYNDSSSTKVISKGERIAQLIFLPYGIMENFEIVDDLSETDRGSGGFGSTGNK